MACSSEEKAKEEDPEEEISVEEKAKAIEMGMRIGLIADEETQKKYIDVFLVCFFFLCPRICISNFL